VWEALGANVPNYIEPFAGSVAVLLRRPGGAGKIETINDLDCYVSNFWRAVQLAPEETAAYADWPVNEADMHARGQYLIEKREEWAERMHRDPELFDAKLAGWWAWGMSTAIGGGWLQRKRPTPRITPDSTGTHRAGQYTSGRGVHQSPEHGRGGVRLAGWIPGNGLHALPALGTSGRAIHAERAHLQEWFTALQRRLRRVRVACGDWQRVLSGAVTGASNTLKNMGGFDLCGVFLDPPYGVKATKTKGTYVENDQSVSAQACQWAIENGDNPHFRIVMAGYEGEHEFPSNWRCVAWKAQGGHGNRNAANKNRHRERLWLSPHCLRSKQTNLFEVA
jgi:site-specific DNA-adenine methylase